MTSPASSEPATRNPQPQTIKKSSSMSSCAPLSPSSPSLRLSLCHLCPSAPLSLCFFPPCVPLLARPRARRCFSRFFECNSARMGRLQPKTVLTVSVRVARSCANMLMDPPNKTVRPSRHVAPVPPPPLACAACASARRQEAYVIGCAYVCRRACICIR
jgi:hypothetical protein